MLRWQQAEGKRHAFDVSRELPPRPGCEFRALCGAVITPQRRDFVELGGKWLDETCWDCDHVWRQIMRTATKTR